MECSPQGSGGGSVGGVQQENAGESGTCHASGWPPRDLGWMPDRPKMVWPAATKPSLTTTPPPTVIGLLLTVRLIYDENE